ncbi:ferredoxin--NADP reductase, chloroplastic [Cyclospora cayetanensis]|uniref:ferredoxin--NADP(+) reductase n=1 Tax=Cyclospora cayetanensis TaxID=88456 RepID=A0A6P6RRL0_9EIME|nr:ferredoxin--NADP reductase, chloroplastic [Cyclospora cayetanensis]
MFRSKKEANIGRSLRVTLLEGSLQTRMLACLVTLRWKAEEVGHAAGPGLRSRAALGNPRHWDCTSVHVLSFHSFSRADTLKIRLEHRELASHYSAYSRLPPGCQPSAAAEALARVAPEENMGPPDEAFHLVFSYDPSILSAKTGAPFHYLEGQSVSFVNLADTRKGSHNAEGPVAKPRLYSVASSLLSPDEGLRHSFSLCVRRHRFWGPDGQHDPSKDGLCSSLLCTAPIGTQFEIAGPVGAALILPEDRKTPIVFACTGTGVAPLRSFLRRILAEPREGRVVAYIGAARASTTPYAHEWRELSRRLPTETLQLRFAYSREMKAPGGGKLYVQHLIDEDGGAIIDLLQQGAVMYTCGRRDMLPPIKSALQAAAERCNMAFEPFLKQLVATKRWRTEVY